LARGMHAAQHMGRVVWRGGLNHTFVGHRTLSTQMRYIPIIP
jgi:hypothetical protein